MIRAPVLATALVRRDGADGEHGSKPKPHAWPMIKPQSLIKIKETRTISQLWTPCVRAYIPKADTNKHGMQTKRRTNLKVYSRPSRAQSRLYHSRYTYGTRGSSQRTAHLKINKLPPQPHPPPHLLSRNLKFQRVVA